MGKYHEVLEVLYCVLEEETQALRVLDYRQLDSLTERKLVALSQLAELESPAACTTTQTLLETIRQRTLQNQLLMVHARELSQGLVDAWAPSFATGPQGSSRFLAIRG
ncbi:MAG: flagellar protein FlgN [Polyangiaceae bacterium]|nr:flagellar protein FlgN [Polyangiaceae bacterium]